VAEEHLLAVVLNYPTILGPFTLEIDPEELTDARNREILEHLVAVQSGAESKPVSYEVEAHRDALKSQLDNQAIMNRVEVLRDAQRTLQKLRKDRNNTLLDELRLDIAAAATENDQETIESLLKAMETLTTEHKNLYPRESPVFRDSRTPRKAKTTFRASDGTP
jgi:hypothetical protein